MCCRAGSYLQAQVQLYRQEGDAVYRDIQQRDSSFSVFDAYNVVVEHGWQLQSSSCDGERVKHYWGAVSFQDCQKSLEQNAVEQRLQRGFRASRRL